jgi:MFS family permease
VIDSKNLHRLLGVPLFLPRELRSNIIHYYFDIAWWGLYMGATVAFVGVYATRIGASAGQIGLLGALPAAISLILSLPFAGLVRQMGAHRATWVGAILNRGPFFFYALLPLGLLNQPQQVWGVLVIATLAAVPNTVLGISFSHLMLEAITPPWRSTVVGVRNAILAIITFGFTVLSGQILTHVAFPLGYQIVFTIGFIGAIATAYHLYKVRPLPELILPEAVRADTPPARFSVSLPRFDIPGRRYLRVLLLLFLFNLINQMAGPLMPGLLVNRLHLNDAWISLGSAAGSFIVFGVSLWIARLTRRTGSRGGTALGAGLLGMQIVVLAWARTPAEYLASVVAGGVASGILATTQLTYQLDHVPQADRSAWFSWSFLLGNAALLIGSLLGPWVSSCIGLPPTLVWIGLLRLVMALIILRWG